MTISFHMTLVSVSPTISKGKEEFAVLIYLVLALKLPTRNSGTKNNLYDGMALEKNQKVKKNSCKQHVYDNQFSPRGEHGKDIADDSWLPPESYRPCTTKLDPVCWAVSLAAVAEVCHEERSGVNNELMCL